MIVRQLTIGSGTAQKIAATGFGDPLIIQNMGSGILYIGVSNAVTNSNGFQVAVAPAVNSQLNLLNYAGDVWGYALTNACDVRVIENVSG